MHSFEKIEETFGSTQFTRVIVEEIVYHDV